MRQADSRRLDRLAGDGSSEAGIDLASLFRVILDQVQDADDGVHVDAFTATVQNAVSNHARVEHWYGAYAANPWAALIGDALEQLASRKILTRDGNTWRTGSAFATGKRLTVVPARKGKHGDVGVIPLAAGEREALAEAEKKRMEVTSLAASLREDGPGLRPLNLEHVAVLEQSMRDYGYRAEFPILVDKKHGRVLDGRHRIAAARRAGIPEPLPERPVTITSDEEAVGFAILVNLQRGWTVAEQNRINADLSAAGLTLADFGRHLGAAAQRERVRAALLEQAATEKPLSHNAIAKLVDSTQPTVKAECDKLIQSLSITECRHRFTEDGKEAPGPKPKAPTAAEEQVKELLLENPQRSNAQIREEVGLSPNQHRVIERERGRLEAEGAIPVVTAREGSDGTVRHVPQAATPPPSGPPSRPQSPPRPTAAETGAESAWSKIMGRLSRLATAWRNGPPDAAAELEELESLRREIDERIEALRR